MVVAAKATLQTSNKQTNNCHRRRAKTPNTPQDSGAGGVLVLISLCVVALMIFPSTHTCSDFLSEPSWKTVFLNNTILLEPPSGLASGGIVASINAGIGAGPEEAGDVGPEFFVFVHTDDNNVVLCDF